jgi:hypothetical protein
LFIPPIRLSGEEESKRVSRAGEKQKRTTTIKEGK